MAARTDTNRVRVRIQDEMSDSLVRTILAYEGGVRGRLISQTAYELVMEAADLDSYPEEVRTRLEELKAESDRKATKKSLEL